MHVALNDILALVGRLDDTPGFDTPRERFRRFLVERVTDLAAVQAIIEESQRFLDEAHHRALQDALALLGRFLGFDTSFGDYDRRSAQYGGRWRSRNLEIVVEGRTAQTSGADVGDLSRALGSAATREGADDGVRRLGLSVISPLYGSRVRLEDALARDTSAVPLRIASLRSLLRLAALVDAGRLTHDEVVRLLTSGIKIDFFVDLMARFDAHRDAVSASAPEPAGGTRVSSSSPSQGEPAYWIVVVADGKIAAPAHSVESVIAGRQILGVSGAGTTDLRVRRDDWLGFIVSGTGLAGQARVESIVGGTTLPRGQHRFSQVFRLKDLQTYTAPVPFGPGTEAIEDRIARWAQADGAGPVLLAVSREEFMNLAGRLPAGDARGSVLGPRLVSRPPQ